MDGAPLGHMAPYGGQHLLVLALLVVLAAVLVPLVRRGVRTAGGAERTRRYLRFAGWALLATSALWTLWGFTPWAWDIHESLPLHFSDALRFIGPIALITGARRAVVISYYWGLTLNMQSVLTPDVNYFVWPPMEFVEYWLAHGSGVLIPLVLVWGIGLRPTAAGCGAAYAAAVGWAAIAFTGNALTGANYGYLNHAPAGPSLLDVMGPWPTYLLVEALAIAVVWALMTLPWVILDRRSGAAADPRSPLVRHRPGTIGPSAPGLAETPAGADTVPG